MTKPSQRPAQLREFGFVLAGGLTLIFGILGPWLRHHPAPLWLWLLNSVLVILALLAPRSLDPLERLWMRLGLGLGAINSRILLTLMFYGIFTPMGVLMRARGHDPLRRRLDPAVASYRLPSPVRPGSHMAKPF
jgi:hypothetical protein